MTILSPDPIAIIKSDGRYPAPAGLDAPLTMMKTALALLDHDGHRNSAAACHLQHAVDLARGARPLAKGEEVDIDLLYPFPIDPVPTVLN